MKSELTMTARPGQTQTGTETSPRAAGWSERLTRRAVLARLGGLSRGRLTLIEGERMLRFGTAESGGAPDVTVRVLDPAFYPALALGGTIGAGEAYMQGLWTTDNLVGLVRLFVLNQQAMSALEGGATWIKDGLARLIHTLRRNTREGSSRNIRAHYDLGNELFALFLDETMTYSAGIFGHPGASLREAQEAKYDRLCRKLALRPEDRVIEIGTGWGGFAIYAASHYGCHVTTTTISPSQHAWAARRIAQAGLGDRITLLLSDYRDLTGCYDKLVSIEMIEAVGHEYYRTFFETCSRLLAPEGIAAMQAITINEQAYEPARRSVDFIQKYIFPGACIPSMGALLDAMKKGGELNLFHFEEINTHYARTLQVWRERFLEQLEAVRGLGYPEPFIRMWEFYLAYCEGGFLERWIGSIQMVLTKPMARPAPIPIVADRA